MDFDTEEALVGGAAMPWVLVGVEGRRVGVADLDIGLGGGTVGLAVGVEDRGVDLDGVVDLEVGEGFVIELVGRVEETVGLIAAGEGLLEAAVGLIEDKVGRDVGVEDLDGLEFVGVSRPVGVAGLDPGPPDDEGRRLTPPDVLCPGEETGCRDTTLVLTVAGSTREFAN